MAELIRGTERERLVAGRAYDPTYGDTTLGEMAAKINRLYAGNGYYNPNLTAAQNASLAASGKEAHAKALSDLMKVYSASDKDLQGKKVMAAADLEGKKIMADASVRGQRIGANAHEQVARITANSNAEQMAAMMSMGGGSGAIRERAAMADKVDLILNAMAAKSAAEKKPGGMSGFLSEIFSGKSGYE